MKFACLVYHEQKEAISEAELAAIVEECQGAAAWNEAMRKGGHHVFTAGLQSVGTARTVRNRNGRVCITDGPFAETKEGLGGMTIIEARDLDEALELVSKFPARLTSVEVRPIMDPSAELTDPGDRMVVAAIQRAASRACEKPSTRATSLSSAAQSAGTRTVQGAVVTSTDITSNNRLRCRRTRRVSERDRASDPSRPGPYHRRDDANPRRPA